ncbi:MAG: twin-arginine translocase TatA/TatE family subunit [Gammaproteobacteria bacterium]|nr:twin-arginine translocase TatA/TatE family subunit [Gammaproteobacteria bacterium]|tara:strand:- start:415 stop:633 length:219 start_codon:yes stop_codon:yes gene_type:complete
MSFGITELVIILIIVLLLFGTAKLKSLGSDLGSAIKGFRNAVGPEEDVKTVSDEGEEIPSTLKQAKQAESKS